ncbi:putative transcription factor/ chromatin remodeling BED-type(Zn) family [Helianthus annuus]|nr:putative transcription factor/ chromatin remodeling BED-type(Zn) family [Helianthus annuus]
MATETTTSTTQQPLPPPVTTESTKSTATKTVKNRFEGLLTIRTKAINGKGAWYWSHLEPIVINSSDNASPNAVKLRCCLCDAVFSASNPSRTASEHLKRGTCPNFDNGSPNAVNPKPTSVTSLPSPTTSFSPQNHRKRNKTTAHSATPISMIQPEPARFSIHGSYPYPNPNPNNPTRPDFLPALLPAPVAMNVNVSGTLTRPDPTQQYHQLSGGKDDLTALAKLENSVRKLKSPKSQPGQALTKSQIASSLNLLSDWVYENCENITFSSLNHPKFKTFLTQLGLPALTRRELAGDRLEFKYQAARSESDDRIRESMFFQLSADGFGSKSKGYNLFDEKIINLSVNLPNGTRVFRRGVFVNGYVFPEHAEDVLMETIVGICGSNGNVQQCVGVVSDGLKSTALKNLEMKHEWMVNICCQFHGVSKLVKDFSKELPLFKNVSDGCYKVANFVNNVSYVRNLFLKYQFQESGRARLLRVPPGTSGNGFEPVFNMVEDVLTSARILQLVLVDESWRKDSMEDQFAREVEEIVRNPQFWREVEAVHSLVKLVKDMAREIEKERPRIGQCLPLWEELRGKVKEWCLKFQIVESDVEKVFNKRFKRNYHPAWAAAFILDPFYLIRDRSGRYMPPFKCLTSDQEKDVDKLITRLVSREEAHIVLMELMKWRTDGLDSVYAQAVQLKQRDPVTGKMKIANPQSSRLVWETYLTEFNSLRKVAVRLIFLHATSCGFKWNSSFLKRARSGNGVEQAQKLIFIAAHSRLERRYSSSSSNDDDDDDDKDAGFCAMANGEDHDMLNEVVFDASSP